MKCPEHPSKELEFFNPIAERLVCSMCCAVGSSVGQRCVDVSTALVEHKDAFGEVAQLSALRRAEFGRLEALLAQQGSVIEVRESEAVRRLKQETERLVTLIRRREEELAALIKADSEIRRAQVQATLDSVRDADHKLEGATLRFSDAARSGVERMQALYEARGLLRSASLFPLPDSSTYTVQSRAVVPEAHLTLTHSLYPMQVPPDISIAIPERQLSLRSEDAKVEGGGGKLNLNHANIDCPSGIIAHMATGGGTREFMNCAESQLIDVTCTAVTVVGSPQNLLDERSNVRGHTPPTVFRTKSQEGARVIFDFGERRVQLSSYVLQHGHAEDHAALRSWQLLGSIDGENWSVVDVRKNDTQLGGPFVVAHYRLQPPASDAAANGGGRSTSTVSQTTASAAAASALSEPFRFIAIQITGPNAVGLYQIELARVEFYGRLLS